MTIRVKVDLLGLSGLQDWVEKAPAELRAVVFQATADSVVLEKDAVRELTPVRTGALLSSIQSSVNEGSRNVIGHVFSKLRYAPFREYGTRTRGHQAYKMFQRGSQQAQPAVNARFEAAIDSLAASFGSGTPSG